VQVLVGQIEHKEPLPRDVEHMNPHKVVEDPPCGGGLGGFAFLGSVSKVEMATPMALSYKTLFPSISTFETPPVHHTLHPAPSPPDAGRYTVPSRFRCQSRDCGYRVRRHCTSRYLPAHLCRILLMEHQVWSRRARQSTLRPRVATINRATTIRRIAMSPRMRQAG
jgi:hypothetical protein